MFNEVLRAPPTLGAARKVMRPERSPEAPEMIVIHEAELKTDHGQSVSVVRRISPTPPATPKASSSGSIAKLHGLPDCITVNWSPATLNVAVLGAPLGFCERAYLSVPEPGPLVPEIKVSQSFEAPPAGVLASHWHTFPALTDTVPVCARNECVRLEGEML